jgi:hypothetical protein
LSHLVSLYCQCQCPFSMTIWLAWYSYTGLLIIFETFSRFWCSWPVLMQVRLPQNRDKCWAIHWTQQLTIRFHKIQEIFLPAEEL